MQAVAEKNMAYDFSGFDRQATAERQARKEKTATRTAAKKARPNVSGFALLSGVVAFVMLIALLFSYVALNEASDMTRKKKAELASLIEKNQMLEIEQDKRMGTPQIRDYAIAQLGMSKIDKSQITYVTTSGGDKFEVVEKDAGEKNSKLVSGLVKGFSTIVEYIN